MAWLCPSCGSSNHDSMAKCVCGLDKSGPAPDEDSAAHPSELHQPWYLSQTFTIIAFLLITPVWAILRLVDKKENRITKIAASIIFALYVGYVGYLYRTSEGMQQTKQETAPVNNNFEADHIATQAATKIGSPAEFNTAEKMLRLNGNLEVAVGKLVLLTPDVMWRSAQPFDIAEVTRSPYSFLGREIRVSGTVYKIEQLPSDELLHGVWYEILMLASNANDPLGATTIDLLYNGDTSNINPESNITCAGYFAGIAESKNSFGGPVEAVVIVGNVIQVLSVKRSSYPEAPPTNGSNIEPRNPIDNANDHNIVNAANPLDLAPHPAMESRDAGIVKPQDVFTSPQPPPLAKTPKKSRLKLPANASNHSEIPDTAKVQRPNAANVIQMLRNPNQN